MDRLTQPLALGIYTPLALAPSPEWIAPRMARVGVETGFFRWGRSRLSCLSFGGIPPSIRLGPSPILLVLCSPYYLSTAVCSCRSECILSVVGPFSLIPHNGCPWRRQNNQMVLVVLFGSVEKEGYHQCEIDENCELKISITVQPPSQIQPLQLPTSRLTLVALYERKRRCKRLGVSLRNDTAKKKNREARSKRP